MESIAWLEESIGWPQEKVRTAATRSSQVQPQAMFSGTAAPNTIRGTATADRTDAPAGNDAFFGRNRADRPDGDRDDATTLTGTAIGMAGGGPGAPVTIRTNDGDAFTGPVVLENPIDVSYGNRQRFGTPGKSQRWVNILGHVPIQGLTSLTYSLNGGPNRPLAVGPDTPAISTSSWTTTSSIRLAATTWSGSGPRSAMERFSEDT
jgi:hypothetical protein